MMNMITIAVTLGRYINGVEAGAESCQDPSIEVTRIGCCHVYYFYRCFYD